MTSGLRSWLEGRDGAVAEEDMCVLYRLQDEIDEAAAATVPLPTDAGGEVLRVGDRVDVLPDGAYEGHRGGTVESLELVAVGTDGGTTYARPGCVAHSEDEGFPERLRRLLDERGLSQADVARAAGISQTALSRWACGVVRPGFDALQRLRAAIGCTWDELMGGE